MKKKIVIFSVLSILGISSALATVKVSACGKEMYTVDEQYFDNTDAWEEWIAEVKAELCK